MVQDDDDTETECPHCAVRSAIDSFELSNSVAVAAIILAACEFVEDAPSEHVRSQGYNYVHGLIETIRQTVSTHKGVAYDQVAANVLLYVLEMGADPSPPPGDEEETAH